MNLKVNSDLEALNVNDNQMSVLVTGGKEDDRAVIQDVIFNALEGAGFRGLSYEANAYSAEPPMEVKSILDALKEQNPAFFDMPITIESARRVYDTDQGNVTNPRDFPKDVPNNDAWDRVTTYTAPGSKIKMELADGALVIRF
jgi:hypothetical protein